MNTNTQPSEHAMRARVNELEQDKARLDWLEEQRADLTHTHAHQWQLVWEEGVLSIYDTPRQILDTARSKERT